MIWTIWWAWLCVAILLGIVEVLVPGFIFLGFAIGALAARGNDADLEAIVKAANYLRITQADEGEGYSEDDKFYGGIGYGNDLRPDLSNLQYALQALKESGAKSDDPAFQRAIKFLERSQNLREVNPKAYYNGEDDNKLVVSGDDGGAIYYPGNSMAGYVELADGTEIKVWDSSGHSRWFVIPERPAGTEGFTDEQLMDLVTTESMIGVALAVQQS